MHARIDDITMLSALLLCPFALMRWLIGTLLWVASDRYEIESGRCECDCDAVLLCLEDALLGRKKMDLTHISYDR